MNEVCVYDGEYVDGRFNGAGVYEGTNGKYDGEFLNGLFDGEGTLYLSDGSGRYEGSWEKGKLVDGKFIFKDDLVYEEEKWGYCTNKDARFVIEIKEGIQRGAPLKYETAVKKHVGKLPPGCYDTIDGYLDPKSYVIKSFEDNKEIRRPDQKEREWILENCRMQPEPEESEQAQEDKSQAKEAGKVAD